ncbi:MAG TPA: GYD domain-containing protein [Acetobacteraceae bacterium]|nr:GYD domain-containing protein [Acetobacteraceae bacterium]
MPKFLIKGSYNAEGMKGLKKDKASGREKALAAACNTVGGKLDGLWYCFGDHDVYGLVDVPSNVHAAAICTNIGASGMFSAVSTTALLTVAEMDQALSEQVTYRAPGT